MDEAIAVHHNRKGESDDFLDQVSGTLGLAGSVDTIITLNRQRTRYGRHAQRDRS
jgi:hypothetical protein